MSNQSVNNLSVYNEAQGRADTVRKNQILYVWALEKDSYNYVICDATDAMPDIVTEPFIQHTYYYKGFLHE